MLSKEWKQFWQIAALLTWGLCSGVVYAETLYISGNLRVGLRADVDQRTPPTSVLTTGMQLEVLGRSAGMVKVRTEDGEEGWIRESYTESEPPAVIKLAALEQKKNQLDAEHATLLAEHEKAQDELKQVKESLASLTEENARLQHDLSSAMGPAVERGFMWFLWVLFFVALCGGGFAAGVAWHRYQTMKKLGGLRF